MKIEELKMRQKRDREDAEEAMRRKREEMEAARMEEVWGKHYQDRFNV